MKEDKKTDDIKKKGFNFKYATYVIVIALVLLLGFYSFKGNLFSSKEVVAKVNSEKITINDVNVLYNSLQGQQPSEVSKTEILDNLVKSKVIYLEARKRGYSVSNEEAENEIDKLLLSSGASREQFLQSIELQGMSKDEFTESFMEQLSAQKFIEGDISNNLDVSKKEIEDYYSDNINLFETGEQATVKHILIGDESLSAEEKEKKAKDLLKKVNKDNFCDYVTDYSTDVASVSKCGEYIFGRNDPYVQEFKDLSFKQKPGSIGTANTQFGTHIIWTVKKSESGYIGFDKVSSQIENFLLSQKTLKKLDEFYKDVKGEYNIKIYSENLI